MGNSGGPPKRKSIAGPGVLSRNLTSDPTRKSTILGSRFLDNNQSVDLQPDIIKGFVPPKENIVIQGHINILHTIDVNQDLLCCQYNEEYDLLAAGSCDSVLNLYRSDTGEFVSSFCDDELLANVAPVTGIKHRPVSKNYPVNKCFTCTYSNGFVKCWNYNFNRCVYTIRENRQTFGITYHPRQPKFVTYGDDCKLYLYDEERKTQERILSHSETAKAHDGHVSRIFAACFNPRSNNELCSGGWDNTVQFWDLRQPFAVRHLSGVHMCGEGIDVNMKGTELLTCSFQRRQPMQLWDYGSGKLISDIDPDGRDSMLYAGKFINSDYAVTAGTDENLIRIIDLQSYMTRGLITGLANGIYALDLGKTKKQKRNAEQHVKKMDFSLIPRLAFVSGKKLYQLDFN